MKRDMTQYDIVEETRRRHPEGPKGFFTTLFEVSDEAFPADWGTGDTPEEEQWVFPMGRLTVGQLVDFFVSAAPTIVWRNEFAGPSAYVVIGDYVLAEAYRDRFGVKWLSTEDIKDRHKEGYGRAIT
jgi:hypothetical protein